MKRFLKYINSIPVPFTMRHYQIFGEATGKMKDQELASPEAWDALRKSHPFFSISPTRAEWLLASEVAIKKDGQDGGLIDRARDVTALLKREGSARIFSVGVGGGALEYQLKKMIPELSVVCSDYSPVTVEALKNVFVESDAVIPFDVLKGDWSEVNRKYLKDRGMCIMYRIDASFGDAEWRSIFQKLYEAGVERVLYIPTGMLTLCSIYNRKSREIKWFFRRIPVVWAGYLRTRKQFERFWAPFYTQELLTFGGLKGFFLERK